MSGYGAAPPGQESQSLFTSLRNIIVQIGAVAQAVAALTTQISTGVMVLPSLSSYTVAALPATAATGAMAYASNGRKPAEGPGAGTGVQAFYDGVAWRSVCDGLTVAA